MPLDPDKLPSELLPYAEALELAAAYPHADRGWQAFNWHAPATPLIPGAPPYDGIYRASWISPGVCLRLDLNAVPEPVRTRLSTHHPDRIGKDGAFYEFAITNSSQRRNRDDALLSLALKIAALASEE